MYPDNNKTFTTLYIYEKLFQGPSHNFKLFNLSIYLSIYLSEFTQPHNTLIHSLLFTFLITNDPDISIL